MKLTRGVGDKAAGAADSAGTIASSIGRAIDAPIPRRNVRRGIASRLTNIAAILTGSKGSKGAKGARVLCTSGTLEPLFPPFGRPSPRALHEEQPRRLL